MGKLSGEQEITASIIFVFLFASIAEGKNVIVSKRGKKYRAFNYVGQKRERSNLQSLPQPLY